MQNAHPNALPLLDHWSEHRRYRLGYIDELAFEIGSEIAETHNIAELRERARTAPNEFLRGSNTDLANALERDVRLAAIPSLHSWANSASDSWNVFVNDYVDVLYRHLEGKPLDKTEDEYVW